MTKPEQPKNKKADQDSPKKSDHYNLVITGQAGSRLEITGEIPVADLEKERAHALAHLAQKVSLKGFRKGHVPEKVLIQHVGEFALLQEMAEHAIEHAYPKIIIENNIAALGQPQITITKLAPGNPLGFRLTTAVVPEVTLPDYKKIAQAVVAKPIDRNVSDEEVESGINHLREQWAKSEKFQHAQKDDPETDPRTIEVKEDELPAITDEWVSKLGPFSDVADFRKRFRSNLEQEKNERVTEAIRAEIMHNIVDETKVDLPDLLIESELAKLEYQFEGEVAQAGLKIDDYLKVVNKTRADLRQEWRADAEERAKTQLVLNKIAEAEGITPDPAAVQSELNRLLEQYHDANEERARIYIESILTNAEVIKFLEQQSATQEKDKKKADN